MRFRFSFVLLPVVLCALSLPAQEQTSVDDLNRRGVALHDAGDYAGAIAAYRQVLAVDPKNALARYELAFSTYASGDAANAASLASAGADEAGRYQVPYLEILGNALDTLGKTSEAIAAYQRAVRIDPKYARVRLNLGVTYYKAGKLRDARDSLENAISLDPFYANAHYLIAEVYRADGYRIPAIFAYARYLSLLPDGPRAKSAAENLRALVHLGVERKPDGNVNITVDPASKKDLGDFSSLEMMLPIAVAAAGLPEKKNLTDQARDADALASFFAMVAEMSGELRRGFVAKTYVPFFASLADAKQNETFANVALLPLVLPGSDDWKQSHAADIAAFRARIEANRK